MKYGVNRQILLIIAGTVWIIAGGNILRIGIVTWMNNSHDWMFKIVTRSPAMCGLKMLPLRQS